MIFEETSEQLCHGIVLDALTLAQGVFQLLAILPKTRAGAIVFKLKAVLFGLALALRLVLLGVSIEGEGQEASASRDGGDGNRKQETIFHRWVLVSYIK